MSGKREREIYHINDLDSIRTFSETIKTLSDDALKQISERAPSLRPDLYEVDKDGNCKYIKVCGIFGSGRLCNPEKRGKSSCSYSHTIAKNMICTDKIIANAFIVTCAHCIRYPHLWQQCRNSDLTPKRQSIGDIAVTNIWVIKVCPSVAEACLVYRNQKLANDIYKDFDSPVEENFQPASKKLSNYRNNFETFGQKDQIDFETFGPKARRDFESATDDSISIPVSNETSGLLKFMYDNCHIKNVVVSKECLIETFADHSELFPRDWGPFEIRYEAELAKEEVDKRKLEIEMAEKRKLEIEIVEKDKIIADLRKFFSSQSVPSPWTPSTSAK
jgi:hypothetical protein